MTDGRDLSIEGRCTCGAVRYRITRKPMFVHCCHCRWCQRETGTAFALNAMIEADHVELLSGSPEAVSTPSQSGKGQKIVRCPRCRIALWSNYAGAGDAICFIRVGTLNEPDNRPRQVVIDHNVGVLQVLTFGEHISRDEHVDGVSWVFVGRFLLPRDTVGVR